MNKTKFCWILKEILKCKKEKNAKGSHTQTKSWSHLLSTECKIIFKSKSVFYLGTNSYPKKSIFSTCFKKKLDRQRAVDTYLKNMVIIYFSLIYKSLNNLFTGKNSS